MTRQSWIYAVVPRWSKSEEGLRMAGFEYTSTPADRGDGYAILRRLVKQPQLFQERLDRHQITSWVRGW